MQKLFLSFVILLLSSAGYSQTKKFPSGKEDKKIFDEAEIWFNEMFYEKALELYKRLEPGNPNAPLLMYRIGSCYMNITGEEEKAAGYMEKANTKELANTEFHYYYGITLHHQLKFNEAIEQFNLFLKIKKIPEDLKSNAEIFILQCETGRELIKTPVPVIIFNIGYPINTSNSEYAPQISSDESVLLYTYRGELSNGGLQPVDPNLPEKKEYYEDIFMTVKDSTGKWIEPLHLEANVNSEGNDACVALPSDAQSMYMFRSINNDPGSIYQSDMDGMVWSDPELVEGSLNSPEWDGSVTISSDGKTAYFSSERKGGNGQRDLYRTKKTKDGKWGQAQNLGSVINTEFNEDAPFLHPSGLYLVFSSDRKNTIGGYDIFVSELQKDSSWGEPKNIGYPINTPGNEKFYTVSANGRHGYFASSKGGGAGKFDIYMVTPGLADRPILLAQVKGKISIDNQPVMARIDIRDKKTNEVLFSVTSNSATGKYLIDLPAGIDYLLTYDVGGFAPETLDVNTVNLTSFMEIIHDVNFNTSGPVTTSESPAKTDSVATPVDNEALRTIPKSRLMDLAHPDLVYRVQIGAYRFPWNFKYQHVMKLGKEDEKEKLDDDITRFTLGRFNTLAEAYAFRDKVRNEGIGDTFVTAIYKGKRYLLVDLGPVLFETLKYETAYQSFMPSPGELVSGK